VGLDGGGHRFVAMALVQISALQGEPVPALGDVSALALVDESTGRPRSSLPTELVNTSGCYAVLNERGDVMYVEISRSLATSLRWHMQSIQPSSLCFAAKVAAGSDRERVQQTAVEWIGAVVKSTGRPPVGNDSRFRNSPWRARPGDAERDRPPVAFPPGADPADATVLLQKLVRNFDVLVFMKGTRSVPLCGFSERMCRVLDEEGIKFETVDAQDELSNPGLRSALQEFAQWPTLPVLVVNGVVLGGTDVIETLQRRGDLQAEFDCARAETR